MLMILSFVIYFILSSTGGIAIDISTDYNENITVNSMLPFKERRTYLVVGNHEEIYIFKCPVENVLRLLQDSEGNYIEIYSNAKVVWSYYKDTNNNVISNDYFVIGESITLDLSLF